MQARFIPIAVFIFPSRNLAAKNVPGFHEDGGMTRVRQIFCAGETSQTCSCNGDTHASNQNLKTTLKGSRPRSLPKVVTNRKRGVLTQYKPPMADTLLKSTTRHVRLFTARVNDGRLIPDPNQLTLDLDPDNEFLWNDSCVQTVQQRFRELVDAHAGQPLNDYNLRRIGSELEGTIRQLLQAGQLSYNPDCRVLNYSMGLPRTPELL